MKNNPRFLFVIYDNESHISWFPQGIAALASVLRQDCDLSFYHQDINHSPDSALTNYLDTEEPFDLIGIGVIAGYWQFKKLIGLSNAINHSKNRPALFLLGGHGPSPDPKYFLNKTNADLVVMGEGEETIKEVVQAFKSNTNFTNIPGIAYQENNEIRINSARDQIKNIDKLPMPAYDSFPINHYKLIRTPWIKATDFSMPILSGRGCPFRCNFCYRMDKGHRSRSAESIIHEISYLQNLHDINYFVFSDELLMLGEKRITSLCESFIRYQEKYRKFTWECNGRLNYANSKILALMKKAGCIYINYGIESMDDNALELMNKSLTVSTIIKGIEATQKENIHIGFNIIWGNLGETCDTLRKGVDFLLKYDNCAELRTIRPVTPYPGTPLFNYAVDQGLLSKDNPVQDFYETKHLNSDLLTINFTNLTDDGFHKALFEANQILINNYYSKKLNISREQSRLLYLEHNSDFRGFRQV